MNGGEGGLSGPTLEADISAFLHWALPAAAVLAAIFFMRALGRWREAEE
ncbi:MAG TPA: hypothetical protein VFR17_09050 [Mycobacterium sp.]|nr:hypothetical protein [Mycobacterium sp.]